MLSPLTAKERIAEMNAAIASQSEAKRLQQEEIDVGKNHAAAMKLQRKIYEVAASAMSPPSGSKVAMPSAAASAMSPPSGSKVVASAMSLPGPKAAASAMSLPGPKVVPSAAASPPGPKVAMPSAASGCMDRYFAELSRTAADRIAEKQAEEEANQREIRRMQAEEEAEQKANMALIRDMQAEEKQCAEDRRLAMSY
jgi:hypothetical protein